MQKMHRLVQVLVIFNVFVILALLVLEPVFAVLWLLLTILFFLFFGIARPDVRRMETERLHAVWSSFKNRLNGVVQEDPRKLTFVPDHQLVSLQAGGPCYLIDRETYVIGRSTRCSCVLRQDPTVSKEHCRIIFRKYSQEYYIEDLRSQNGTYLGTRRLEPFTQEKLLDDTELTVGGCSFRFVRNQGV